MGNSNSSSNLVVTNNTVNKNTVNNCNKDIINMGVETLIKMNQNCSSTVVQTNNCKMDNLMITGSKNFNIGGVQDNTATTNLTCTQWAKATNEMNNSMLLTMMDKVKTLNGTESATNVNAAVSAKTSAGSFSLPIGSSSSTSNGNVTNNITNETFSFIENIYETNLKNSFTSENLQSCVVSSNQNNVTDLSNGTLTNSDNISVGCNQQNSIEQILNCKQLNDAVISTGTDTLKKLGLTVDNTDLTDNRTKSKTSVSSDKVSTGFIQDITAGIGNVIGSIGSLLSFQNGGSTISIIIICVLLIISGGGYFFTKSQGGGGKKNNGYVKNSESNYKNSDNNILNLENYIFNSDSSFYS